MPSLSRGTALDAVQRMTERMHSRGPDAKGVWQSEGVVLGHRRLAIIDLDNRANQPMVSGDRRHAIVFNGEIYNFRELRQELEAHGMTFRTTSDTEVLLMLFAREGERMLPRLRGMFAFAVWNSETRELFMARDPYGIKPLYYSSTPKAFFFASQVKALLASRVVPVEAEPAGLAGFYLWGSVPEPWTLFRSLFALPAGHWLRVRDGIAETPVCWHDVRAHWRIAAARTTTQRLQEQLREAVSDSVRAHLVADVPTSVFLSGGIDSAAIAALASESGSRVEGITIGFQEFAGRQEDEVPAAAAVAAHYGLPHHVRMISHAEFEEDLPRIFDAMDQPSIDGINTWFASKAAAERGYKVALSGVGGDEIFCGYSLFRQIPPQALVGRALAAIPGARFLLERPCAYLAKQRSQPKLAGVPEFLGSLEGMYFLRRGLFLPSELPALLGADLARDGLARLHAPPVGIMSAQARNGTAAVGLLESTLYLRNQLLRDNDWASMGHSLELRTPFVDAKLLETLGPFVSGFAGRAGKMMLARSPTRSLPSAIATRHKTGFALPMANWSSDSMPTSACDARPHSSWARPWAKFVIERMIQCA